MSFNITVTEIAQDKFRAALEEEPSDTGVRLAVQKQGPVNLRYELELISAEEKTSDDAEIVAGAVKFWIDPQSAVLIDGATIDYLEGPASAGFKFTNPNDLRYRKWDDPIAAKFQELLETEINPGIAAHEGFITLVDYANGIASVHMGGGCQGCGQAAATLREGVEARVKHLIPEITEIVDATDHDSGENPFY